MKTIFVILDISVYGYPEIVEYHSTEEAAIKAVAKYNSMGHDKCTFEVLNVY